MITDFAADGFHPNAVGYHLWADDFWKRAERLARTHARARRTGLQSGRRLLSGQRCRGAHAARVSMRAVPLLNRSGLSRDEVF